MNHALIINMRFWDFFKPKKAKKPVRKKTTTPRRKGKKDPAIANAFARVRRDMKRINKSVEIANEVIQDHTSILQTHDDRFSHFEEKITSLEDKILKEPMRSLVKRENFPQSKFNIFYSSF